jgi:hypothetical protein
MGNKIKIIKMKRKRKIKMKTDIKIMQQSKVSKYKKQSQSIRMIINNTENKNKQILCFQEAVNSGKIEPMNQMKLLKITKKRKYLP